MQFRAPGLLQSLDTARPETESYQGYVVRYVVTLPPTTPSMKTAIRLVTLSSGGPFSRLNSSVIGSMAKMATMRGLIGPHSADGAQLLMTVSEIGSHSAVGSRLMRSLVPCTSALRIPSDRLQEIEEVHRRRLSAGRDGGSVTAAPLEKFIEHAVGSVERPMSDSDLDAKVRNLCDGALPATRTRRLIDLCRTIERAPQARVIAEVARL
jgi:hypothetical protein